jgi:uncharacterized protein
MNVHPLKRINVGSLPPEGTSVSGEITPAEAGVSEDDRVNLPNPIKYELQLSVVSGAFLARGLLTTIIRPRCDRCLHYYDLKIEAQDFCHYFENVNDEVFDLTEAVCEDIVLAFPQRMLCRDDCRGLCPQCGQNLNVRTCDCHEARTNDGVWQKLDNLNLDQ